MTSPSRQTKPPRHFLRIVVFGLLALLGGTTRGAEAVASVREPAVVTCLAASPALDRLATGGDDHFIRLWDWRGHVLERELHGHTDWVRALDFLPDGRHLVSAGADGRVLLWNPAQDEPPVQLHHQPQSISSLAVLSATHLAIAGFSQPIRILDLNQRQIVSELSGPCRDARVVVASPDKNWLAAGGRNGQIRIWSVDGQRFTFARDIRAHDQRLRALVFSQDGRLLISGGEDRTICVWEVATGEEVSHLQRLSGKVLALAILDERHLAAAGADNRIIVFDLETWEQTGSLEGHTGSVSALTALPGILISGGYDASIRIWEKPLWEEGESQTPVSCLRAPHASNGHPHLPRSCFRGSRERS